MLMVDGRTSFLHALARLSGETRAGYFLMDSVTLLDIFGFEKGWCGGCEGDTPQRNTCHYEHT